MGAVAEGLGAALDGSRWVALSPDRTIYLPFPVATAADVLEKGTADLVAFGRSFLANPDLVTRIARDASLNQPDFQTLYTPGEKGYTDYPVLPAN